MQIPQLLKSYNGLPISNKTTAMIADYLKDINKAIIYGWHVDPNISDSYNAITYLNDAIGKTPASMGISTFNYGDWQNSFFMPKPCMLNYDGTVDYYLDRDEYERLPSDTFVNVASDIGVELGGNGMSKGQPFFVAGWVRSSDYIPVTQSNIYIGPNKFVRNSLINGGILRMMYVYEFDANKNFLNFSYTDNAYNGSTPITLQANTRYVKFNYGGGSLEGIVTPNTIGNCFVVSYTPIGTDISNPSYNGNAMMEWPLIYYKFEGPESKDYRPVEYIKCTGTQYILTDIIPNYQMRIDAEIMLGNSVVNTSKGGIFGFINNNRRFAMLLTTDHVSSDTVNIYGYCGYPWSSPDSNFSFREKQVSTFNTKLLWRLSHSELRVGNDTRNSLPIISQQPPNQNLVIMGMINTDNIIYSFGMMNYMQLYSLKIYDENDILIHDLQPMERQSDGELGLYDKMTDMFYTNSGTGTFTKGAYLDEGEGFFYCSDKKVDNTFNCWCNYDSNNNIIPHFYTSIYNGCIINNKMRSLSGRSLEPNSGYGNTTGQQEVDAAIANDTTADVEWYTDVISDRLLISALLILISKNLNNKVAFGRGLDSSGESTHHDQYTTGTLNNKGLFWGDTSTGTQGVKVFGMEGWYACRYRRIAGLVSIPKNNIMYYGYKLTYGTIDGSVVSSYNSTGNGYLLTDFPTPTASSTMFVKQMNFGRHGFLPSVLDNNSIMSQYYATAFYPYTNVYAITSGSSVNASGYTGSMYFGFGMAFNDTNQYAGTGLSCKPILRNNG